MTTRQAEVLQLVAAGLTNVEIGRILWLSPDTVKGHLRRLLADMGARNRAHAVAIALAPHGIELTRLRGRPALVAYPDPDRAAVSVRAVGATVGA